MRIFTVGYCKNNSMENTPEKKDLHNVSIKTIRPLIAQKQAEHLLQTGRHLTIPRAIIQIVQECKKC